ncbi:MAG: hypothetical protein WKF58_12035 [Ilumatobacteraceae bacterium]
MQVTLPTNQAFIDEFGPYRQRLDVGDHDATAVTRKLRRRWPRRFRAVDAGDAARTCPVRQRW